MSAHTTILGSFILRLSCILLATGPYAMTQTTSEVRVHIAYPDSKSAKSPPAVVWLTPVDGGKVESAKPGRYVLAQKNRTFVPHLLVIPVGSTVSFPNTDPFFHNVFSLFNGKRFDLGLYEAGSTREITFSREGVSYIFCNIHSEMSAVVLALSTPLVATADASSNAIVRNVPEGDYDLHVWVEGTPEPMLNSLTRRRHVHTAAAQSVTVNLPARPLNNQQHLNEFGQPYDHSEHSPY